jgi:hypothetical protein
VASSASVAKKLLEEKDLMDKILQILSKDLSQTVLIEVHYIFFNFSSIVDINSFLFIAHKYEFIGKVANNLVKEDNPTVIFLESILLLLDIYY